MLQILRKKAQSTFIQIIVVIIALVFIFWGVGANLGGDRQTALTVNDEEITFQQFQVAYDQAYQRLSEQFGGTLPKGLADSLNIKQQVIDQLIQTALLRQGAAAMGLTVSAEEVRRTIEGMAQFQENGQFSLDRYKEILALNRMAPTKFEESLRHDRLAEVATRAIASFATVSTDLEVREIYGRVNEKVAVRYLTITRDAFLDKVTVDDQALTEWFTTAQENYRSAPQVRLSYLSYPFAEIADQITIDEEKVAAWYRDNQADFTTKEQRRARHILFTASQDDPPELHRQKAARAAEVREMAMAGADFAQLARDHSEETAQDGGDLGYFSAGEMVPSFDQAVFSLQPGEISEVVTTPFGYHLIRLEDIRPAQVRELAEAREEIIALLQRREAEGMAFQLANAAYEGIIGAGSLTAYIDKHPEAPLRQSQFFDRQTAPPELRDDPQLLNAALNLKGGELSSLLKGENGYAVLFAEERKEPELPAFADIRTTLATDYRKFRAAEMAAEAAEAALTALQGGRDLAEIAAEGGYTVEESGLLGKTRSSQESGFPAELREDAFLLSASSPLPEKPGKVGDDYYLYRFVERELPTMPDDPAETERYRSSLLEFKQQQLLTSWLQHLQGEAKITRNQAL